MTVWPLTDGLSDEDTVVVVAIEFVTDNFRLMTAEEMRNSTYVVYDGPDLYNRRGIVASNGPLHDFVIATLAPHVPKTD